MSYALDLSAPENRLPRNTGIVRSSSIDQWIDKFFDADAEGDTDGRRIALRAIVDTNRADYNFSGIPVYAHAPLPTDFVNEVISAIEALPARLQRGAADAFVNDLDQDRRPMVMQQLAMQASDRRPSGGRPQRAPDPDSPEARKWADEVGAKDPLAAVLHPFAYGGDMAMNDLFGKGGLFGDWGWRRKIPTPSGILPRTVGEGARFYLEGGPFSWGRLGRLGGRGVAKSRAPAASARSRASAPAAESQAAATKSRAPAKAESTAESTAGKKRLHTCNVSCHAYAAVPGAQCPAFVTGVGTGTSEDAACKAAKAMANASLPRGCQKRHCNCRCG